MRLRLLCRRLLGACALYLAGWPLIGQSEPVDVSHIQVVTEQWQGYTHSDGSGAYFDLLRLVFVPGQYQLNIDFMPFGRTVAAVEKQSADIALSLAPEDAKSALLSAFPIDSDRIVALYSSSRVVQKPLQIADLPNYHLSWHLSYNFGAVLGLDVSGYEVSSIEQGVLLLSNGRVDILLAEESELKPLTKTPLLNGLQQSLLKVAPVYLGFANNEKGRQLKRIWDSRWQQLQGSKTLAAYYQRYPGMRLTEQVCQSVTQC